jgi:hypothetical protein
MQKGQLPCAVGAAVRGQANEPGDLQIGVHPCRKCWKPAAQPLEKHARGGELRLYASNRRGVEGSRDARMPGSPSLSSGTSGGAVQQGEQPRMHSLVCSCWNVCSGGTQRRSWLSPPATLYCREWPHASGRVAVRGMLTSRATCLSKSPRLHPPLLFGQWKLRNTG